MSRPPPKVLLSTHKHDTSKTTSIIESNSVWAVFYKNSPINIKITSMLAFVAPKYRITTFVNKGHAINLAKKLNHQFKTIDFTVVVLSYAETIYSE
jgi:hypothetical protein